jgi:membrane fusion protein (multidrug efflux system)
MTSNTMTEHLGAVPLPAPRAPAQRKRQLLAAALVVAGLAVLGYGTHWWRTGRFLESTDDAYIGGDVTVMAAKVPGYIAEVAVTDNQAVHAGELLVKIDPRDYQAALAKAEGAVAAAQATLANLDATEQLQQAVIAQARTVSARPAGPGALPRSVEQIGGVAAKCPKGRCRIQAGAGLRPESRRHGERCAAPARRDRHPKAASPRGAGTGERRTRPGPLEPGLYRIARAHRRHHRQPAHGLWVDANFKEDQLARIEPGMRATVHADVLPGRVFHGTVGSLAPATGAQFSILPPENATGNFTKIVQRVPVRILLDAQDGTLGVLRPGLSAVAEIDTRAAGTGARP